MQLLFVVFVLLFFGFIAFVVLYFQKRYSKVNQQISRRFKAIALSRHHSKALSNEEREVTNRERILVWLRKYPWVLHLNRKLLMSGRDVKVDEFLVVTIVLWLLCVLILWASGLSLLTGLVLSVVVGSIPYIILNMLIRRRQNALERQLPDVLDFIARSLQAGHSFSSSMQMAASESPEPIAQEFTLASNQINFGESVHNALFGLTQRIECSDMNYFAVAVLINREIGGDLAALLKHVSDMIRTRLQLRMSIQAMTSEARVSAWILGLIPVVLGLTLTILQPKMMSILIVDPTGQKLLGGSLLVMALGVVWMRSMINIRV
mgnify:CR=1 FL=1